MELAHLHQQSSEVESKEAKVKSNEVKVESSEVEVKVEANKTCSARSFQLVGMNDTDMTLSKLESFEFIVKPSPVEGSSSCPTMTVTSSAEPGLCE